MARPPKLSDRAWHPLVAARDESPVLILTGAPGVGKTTTARTLAVRFDRAVHLQADAFFDFIRSGFVEPWKPESREQNEIVIGILADAVPFTSARGPPTHPTCWLNVFEADHS